MSRNSYTMATTKGAIRHLHANNLPKFNVRVNSVEVIFEDESNTFGEKECYETGVGTISKGEHCLNKEKLDVLDLAHLSLHQ